MTSCVWVTVAWRRTVQGLIALLTSLPLLADHRLHNCAHWGRHHNCRDQCCLARAQGSCAIPSGGIAPVHGAAPRCLGLHRAAVAVARARLLHCPHAAVRWARGGVGTGVQVQRALSTCLVQGEDDVINDETHILLRKMVRPEDTPALRLPTVLCRLPASCRPSTVDSCQRQSPPDWQLHVDEPARQAPQDAGCGGSRRRGQDSERALQRPRRLE